MIKETFCAEDTYELGRQTASSASPGDVIALSGDLGCGKKRMNIRQITKAIVISSFPIPDCWA